MYRIIALIAFTLLPSLAFGQVAINIQTNRKSYISYEPVQAIVTITNQTGHQLALQNNQGVPWIEFVIRNQNGKTVNRVSSVSYTGTSIPISQSIKSQFILNNTFDLSSAGSYTLYAIVRTPNQTAEQGTRSRSVFFNVSHGTPLWRTTVGVPNSPGDEREYRIINHNANGVLKIYVQVRDPKLGLVLATYSMGNTLSFNRSLKAIDHKNNLHVLFRTTPLLYCHTVVNIAGKTIKRNYYKVSQESTQAPYLHTTPNGDIQVMNARFYDPEKEREKMKQFHNISEQPSL